MNRENIFITVTLKQLHIELGSLGRGANGFTKHFIVQGEGGGAAEWEESLHTAGMGSSAWMSIFFYLLFLALGVFLSIIKTCWLSFAQTARLSTSISEVYLFTRESTWNSFFNVTFFFHLVVPVALLPCSWCVMQQDSLSFFFNYIVLKEKLSNVYYDTCFIYKFVLDYISRNWVYISFFK